MEITPVKTQVVNVYKKLAQKPLAELSEKQAKFLNLGNEIMEPKSFVQKLKNFFLGKKTLLVDAYSDTFGRQVKVDNWHFQN